MVQKEKAKYNPMLVARRQPHFLPNTGSFEKKRVGRDVWILFVLKKVEIVSARDDFEIVSARDDFEIVSSRDDFTIYLFIFLIFKQINKTR